MLSIIPRVSMTTCGLGFPASKATGISGFDGEEVCMEYGWITQDCSVFRYSANTHCMQSTVYNLRVAIEQIEEVLV